MCVSRLLFEKSILRKLGNIGSSHTVNFSKGTWHHEKKGKEKVHRKELFKSASLKKAIRVRQNLRKDTSGNLATASMRPQRSMGFRETCLQSQSNGPGHVPLPYRSLGNTGTLFEKARGARIRGGFRSINAHAEQKRFELSGNGNPSKIRNFTTVITVNGEVETSEEAQGYVDDLELSVTVQSLDYTRAVLSLGKLCEEHIPLSGPVVKKATTDQELEHFCETRKFSFLLSSQDCHPA